MGNTQWTPCTEPEPPSSHNYHAQSMTPPAAAYAPRTSAPMVTSYASSSHTPAFCSGVAPHIQQSNFEKKYELLNIIGQGSTSTVRRCRERSTRRELACKVIDKKKVNAHYSPVMEQFENEIDVLIRLQATMKHPNIITLQDVFITTTHIYMVMEQMRGGELFDYVVQRGTLNELEVCTAPRGASSARTASSSGLMFFFSVLPAGLDHASQDHRRSGTHAPAGHHSPGPQTRKVMAQKYTALRLSGACE